MSAHACLRVAAILSGLTLWSAPAEALVTFTSPFPCGGPDWVAPVSFSAPPGGMVSATCMPYRDVLDALGPPVSGNTQAYGFHIYQNHSYDPSAGAIVSLTFSIGYNRGASNGPSGTDQAYGPAILQNGMYYFINTGSPASSAHVWYQSPSVTLFENQFQQMTSSGVANPNSHPSFTAPGPMQFGFYTANSGGSAYSVEEGYDNWTVTLETKPAPQTGQVKICKIAGPGIAPNAPFQFNFIPAFPPVTVPAGPPPGGNCALGPAAAVGSNLLVQEVIPSGDSVTNIVVPAPGVVSQPPNLAAGTVGVTVGSGVTEVVYTDRGSGWLEVCKQVDHGGAAGPGQFSFTVNPSDPNHPPPFSVQAGACSPPIQVPAGQTVIQESPTPGWGIVNCTTIPVGQQVGCTTQSSVVNVAAGNLSTQTIAIIRNAPH